MNKDGSSGPSVVLSLQEIINELQSPECTSPLLLFFQVHLSQVPFTPTLVACSSSTSLRRSILKEASLQTWENDVCVVGEGSLYWLLKILPMGWQVFEPKLWSQALLKLSVLFLYQTWDGRRL